MLWEEEKKKSPHDHLVKPGSALPRPWTFFGADLANAMYNERMYDFSLHFSEISVKHRNATSSLLS